MDTEGCQEGPLQVPSSDRHTLPQLYRLGLNRTLPPPVVRNFICMQHSHRGSPPLSSRALLRAQTLRNVRSGTLLERVGAGAHHGGDVGEGVGEEDVE